MLARLLRYRPGPEWLSRPWALVIAFFTLLMILHFAFLTTTSHTLHSSTTTENATTTLSSQNAPAAPDDTGTFKAFLNGMGISKASSSTENEKLAEPEEEYVAVCMAVKDQHLDLQEFFIHHYHHLGIRRFYIMDDGSEPPLSSYKDYGIPRKHLTFHYYDRKDRVQGMQHHVYDACINLYRERHVWMTFIDADEMFEMTGEETLIQMLERWEKDRSVGALAVSWKTHGSNGILTRPASARKAFTDCIWDGEGHNKWFKSIVKTEFYAGMWTVHQAKLHGDTKTVGEDGKWIGENENKREPPTKNRIALHHYALKSKEEYEQKINRSNANDDPKDWTFWGSVESMAGVPCEEMTQYEP